VLALLALHANQVVPSGRVLVELWGEDAPPRAANALHVAVLRLRQVLPPGRLITRTPGYLLRLAPEELDLGRFERLLADGREALAAGAATEAARTLRLALSLWRGPVLADFRYEPFAQVEIARLEELRLVCAEERIQADLALGAAGELVGELRRLVAEQPLRERLRSQLMLALYRSGRQAEALAVYRELRGLLIEELGLEPGPVLRELEAAILRHDPALATPPPAAPAPVRKPVTVLCAELRLGSTPGASLDPEALSGVYERALAVLVSTLERYGGKLAATAGERVVGVFGISALHEDDALRAAQASLAARDALDAQAAALQQERGRRLTVRFGLATGEVLVGGPTPPGFAGDAIAHASELAASAAPGEIYLSEETYRLAAGALEVQPVRPGQLRLQAARIGVRPLAVRLDAPLVGRDAELGRLSEAFTRARRDRKPVLMSVFGEAGIGKTRLAYELARRLAGDATVLTGHCLPYGEGITFWPLRELVRQAGAPQGTRDQLQELLSDQADAARVAEQLAAASGPSEPVAVAASEIFWATRRLLETLARRWPLLIVLEDLHWAEPTFLDLVESLATPAPDASAPLLLLCLARPELLEQRPAWVTGAVGAEALELQPLADDAATALLDELTGTRRLPASAHRQLLEAAGGNPFFLEQLAASLSERRWGDDLPLPPTIQALLAARLERLGPGEHAVLARAAVLGSDFWSQGVAELLPEQARAPLHRHLQALVAKGLVQPGPSHDRVDEDFRFRHILIQQAAYRAIPKSLRADLHERFADWLQRRDGGRASQYDEILGYHLEQAYRYRAELGPPGERERQLARRAAQRLAAAGRRASARIDLPAAANLLGRATALLSEDDPTYAELLWEFGVALNRRGGDPRVEEVLTEVIQHASASGDGRLAARARLDRWVARADSMPRRYLEAIPDDVQTLIPELEALGDDLGLTKAWQLIAYRHWLVCEFDATRQPLDRALLHARRSGDRLEETEALGGLLWAYRWGPTPVEEGIHRCEDILQEVGGDRRIQAQVLATQGVLQAMLGRFQEARLLLARTGEIYQDLGLPFGAAMTSEGLLEVEMLGADPVQAERTARAVYEERTWVSNRAAAALAVALCDQERYEEAARYAEISRERLTDRVMDQVIWRTASTQALAGLGRLDQAVRLGREAVTIAGTTDALNLHGDALMGLANACRHAHQRKEAAESARQALDRYVRKGNVVSAQKAETLLQ
jgi:DNA-binding SARP family transcriptional activator